MKQDVSDRETLGTCKRILDTWSAAQAYSPTRQLGTDSKFVSAQAFTIERFSLESGVRTRRFVHKQLKNGSAYYEHPDSISQYNIWEDVKPDAKREAFEEPIDKTTYAKECPTCEGDGVTICQKCDGRGSVHCTRNHTSFFLNGHKYENMVPVGCSLVFSQKVIFNQNEYYRCDCDPKTHIRKCSCNDGHVTCKTCDGHGKLVYEWFLEQRYKKISKSRVWKLNEILSDRFYNVDKLPWRTLYEREVEDEMFTPCVPSDASEDAVKSMAAVALGEAWQTFDEEIKEEVGAFKSEGDDKAVLRPSFQSAKFEQYDGIVRYVYEYEGKEYVAWINLATEDVEEGEGGLYASIAEETVRLAKDSEQSDPQKAIYYYCKADAISLKWGKENGTQQKRETQYRRLGCLFAGILLICVAGGWIPALFMSGMNIGGLVASIVGLAVVTFCMASLNEALQLCGFALVFGLTYASKRWFGSEIADDLVFREGLLMGYVSYALVVMALTTDFAQRLPGGRKGLMFGGLAAGLCSLPLPLFIALEMQSFVALGGMFLPLCWLLSVAVLRFPYRLKAGKMQRFVEKNLGRGEVVRREIEKRHPGKEGLVSMAIVLGGFMALSVLGALMCGFVDDSIGNLHFKFITVLQDSGIL